MSKTGGCSDYIKDNSEDIIRRLRNLEPEIYYQSSEEMSHIDSDSADLIVTSPPYPMIEYWDKFGDYEEQHDMIENVLDECWRVLREGGIMCINIGDATRSVDDNFKLYPNHSEITIRAENIGFDSLIPIHWFKPSNKPNSFLGSGFYPPNGYVTQDTEYILIFRKGETRSLPGDRTLWDASKFTKEERDTWFCQQWQIHGVNQDGTAQFPLDIPYRLIRMFSIMGDTVLDPFAGTGTTLKMAKALGRKGVGYEIDEGRRGDVEDSLDTVSDISGEDVLVNLIRNEDADGSEPDRFIENTTPLIDYFSSENT